MTYIPDRLIQNYQTLATDTSERTLSTSVLIYDNTEIEYTPPTGAEYVVYVANFNSESKPDRGSTFSNTRLQESTNSGVTWSDIDGCKLFEGHIRLNDNTFIAHSLYQLGLGQECLEQDSTQVFRGAKTLVYTKWKNGMEQQKQNTATQAF